MRKRDAVLTMGLAWLVSVSPVEAELKQVEIDRGRSSFSARTGTAGMLGFLGHPHGILATEWEARACIDPTDPSRGETTVVVRVASLQIDTPAALESVGLERAFDEAEQRELQEKMLGAEALAVKDHPTMSFLSTALRPAKKGMVLEGKLTLHGQERSVTLPLVLSGLERGEVDVRADFEIRLTDYGIEPESIAGVVKVADRVDLRLAIHGRLTEAPCAAGE